MKIVNILLICLLCCACGKKSTTEPNNHNPEIKSLTATPDQIGKSESSGLQCIAEDPDGDDLVYSWEAPSGSINGSGDSVIWIAPDATGTFWIVCNVSDNNGGQDDDSVSIEVINKIPIEGLIAYWPFNGNADDESGNEINGTVIGAILSSDRHGINNSAYSFDGQNDYIEADASNLPTAERTISLWFYANSVDNRPGLLGYGGTSSTRGTSWFMGINLNGLKSFHMSCHWLINRIDYYYTNPPVEEWYHWVITINNSGTKIYINGVEEESNTTFVDNTYVNGKELGIGVIVSTNGIVPYTDGNVKYFNGSIDDIRIYNRALNEAEIQALYHEGGWSE
jgi:hypothetical protein